MLSSTFSSYSFPPPPSMDTSSLLRNAKKASSRIGKAFMKSHRLEIPKYDLPLRFRPWFFLFTCAIMVILAFLGFTNFSRALPINDKILHFLCFGVATGVFYFIIDVDESAKRYKEFDWFDVLANLCGSSLGLWVSYNLERYYRRRREIARLYQPLSDSYSDLEDDQEDGTDLLPLHNNDANTKSNKNARVANVWDEREELFDLGDDSDDEYPQRPAASSTNGAPAPDTPKIVITHS
ncbi:hypothetical protein D9619_001440 [Psilocybe cf. subviscida]|uniref:VanZ-like domain-containing protein n=1 Tax=Psilocybe cf. subviscida TaxID=2480587 RepID=A0A8H5F2Z2_9AGAR|nr:hypothetical protein D9619_001440 [Psilocybe cf. subviscida]